jgi:hypothetical protein
MPRNTHDYIPDHVLERLYLEGALKVVFYKTVRIRREYPELAKEVGPRPALEILAKRYYLEVETVKEYLWRTLYKN